MIWSLLFCLLLAPKDEPYILWLSNNKSMTVKARPDCTGRLCTVELLNGEKTSLPSAYVDLDRSDKYNEELAKKRSEEKAAAEESARLKAAALEKERAKNANKVVVLTAEDELPKYDRSAASVSDQVKEAADVGIIGEPVVNTFTSSDPIYLARETITRYEDRYTIDCEIVVTAGNSASKLELDLKVRFDSLPAESYKEKRSNISAGRLNIKFTINQSDKLMSTEYLVTGIEVR